MDDPRKDILNRVARGEISPEEGATLLDDLAAGRATATAPPPGPAATRVRVRRALGSIIIEGDNSVREAVVASGRHSAHREGDTLVIEGDDESGEFAFVWAGRKQIRLGRPPHAQPQT